MELLTNRPVTQQRPVQWLAWRCWLPALCLLGLGGCAFPAGRPAPVAASPLLGPGQYEVFGQVYEELASSHGYLEIGVASWYGSKFHGRLTAMGETYNMYAMTAAHKSLPLPTLVKVTNLDNAQSIVVRVNDRGPFFDDRLIDLSYAAAQAIGFGQRGTVPVVVEAVDELNYPEQLPQPRRVSTYLQVGAFTIHQGAKLQLQAVQQALAGKVPSRILESKTGDKVIYKVWVGPVSSKREGEQLALLLEARDLGKPIRVQID